MSCTEQARGERVDTRSDIFSFGIVMFEVLRVGHLPFNGPNSIALLHNLHFSAPRELSELRPEIPKPLVALVSKMLEKNAAKRIQAMAEVGIELRRGAAGLVRGPLTWHPSDATLEVCRARGRVLSGLPEDFSGMEFGRRSWGWRLCSGWDRLPVGIFIREQYLRLPRHRIYRRMRARTRSISGHGRIWTISIEKEIWIRRSAYWRGRCSLILNRRAVRRP